jgi:Mor family transcriptional regulator
MEAAIDLIPDSVLEMIEITDRQTAMCLVDRFGGREIYIPHAPVEGQILVEAIGLEAASALAFRYGGSYLHIPVCRSFWVALRNQEIQAAKRKGIKTSELAQQFNLSRRRIQEILASASSGGERIQQAG